jgi:hypothetical protein
MISPDQIPAPAPVPQEKKTPPGPLSAAHISLEGASNCVKCHAAGNKINADACLACHKPIADRIAAKKGAHRDVTGDCEVCHVEHQGKDADLKPIERDKFDHREETGFALEGKHTATAETCGKCHPTRSFLNSKPACQTCHLDPHQGAMKESCTACHTPAGWAKAARGFHKDTDFPLEGRHLTVDCASCHLKGVVKGTPKRCYDCHWIRRQDDPYRTRLGNQCEECHKPTAWTAVNWEHGARTGQPLNGAHRTLNCNGCHKNQTFKGTSPDCYSCHRENYEETRKPDHRATGFPTTCGLCHRPSDSSFRQGTFNHDQFFAKVGLHATLDCAACHKNSLYKGTPKDCYGCHRSDYEQTQKPNHAAAGFPTTCETCHRANDSSFNRATFNHNQFFTKVGVHATLTCTACHKNNFYKGTPQNCYGCHRTNYEQAKNPNHLTAGFPTSCETCHRASDATFNQASFNHNQFFTKVGVHATLTCTACHKNNIYKGTPQNCYGCHRTNYEQAKNPNHQTAGFPTTCESCHRASDPTFNQAFFNHNQFFVKVGVHATLNCASCHKNNVYKGTPRDCYGCHRTNYEQARNPNHLTAGFPTTCEACHKATDSSFNQGKFNHSWFPIASGRHAGNNCSACHPDPNNYKAFSCLTCHTRSSTDSNHRGVSGYVYNSVNCYACHPQGRH